MTYGSTLSFMPAAWSHNSCDLQVIELPIKHPELFESLGVAQPKVRHRSHIALSALFSCCTLLPK